MAAEGIVAVESPMSRGAVIGKVIAGIIILTLFVWGFFWAAGSWDWVAGWLYIALFTVAQTVSSLWVKAKNPGLLTARAQLGEGTKGWDKVLLSVFGLTYLGILVVGALDASRFGWAPLPSWCIPVGAALYLAATWLLTVTMCENPHFEKTVRIQTDRGHRVIDTGPYARVRHPGYVGVIGGFILAAPLLLGSAWAFVPALASVLTLVVRTALEDRTLQAELPGYAEYAGRVRYRLIPGIW